MLPEREVASEDGRIRMTVRLPWKADPSLNAIASLGASDRVRGLFLMVLSEDDSAYHDQLGAYLELMADQVGASLENLEVFETSEFTLDGHPAARLELTGTLDGTKLAYIVTVTHRRGEMLAIYAWSSPSQFARHHDELTKVVSTLHVNGPRPPPPASAYALTERWEDSGVSFMTPDGWVVSPVSATPDASLVLQARDSSAFLMVIPDDKADLDEGFDLDEFSRVVLDSLVSSLAEGEMDPPTQTTLGGLDAKTTWVRGQLDTLPLIYRHAALETPLRFVQISAWCAPGVEKRTKLLDDIIGSIQDASPTE